MVDNSCCSIFSCNGLLLQRSPHQCPIPWTKTAALCHIVFANDDPAHFATVHSAHPTWCSVKMLMTMLPTATLIQTAPHVLKKSANTATNENPVAVHYQVPRLSDEKG